MSEHGSDRVVGYNNGIPAVWETRGPSEASLKAIDGYLGGVRLSRAGSWDAIWNGRRFGYHQKAFKTRGEAEAHVEAEAWRLGRLWEEPSIWTDYNDVQSIVLIRGTRWKVADVILLDGPAYKVQGWTASARYCRSSSTPWVHRSYGHPTRDAAKAAAEAWLRQKRVIW